MKNKYEPGEITYELFGIDPAEFYRTKFAHGRGPANALDIPFCRYEIGYEGIRRLIADLQRYLPGGGKALDVGCGAATYGPTLLANVPGLILYGRVFGPAFTAYDTPPEPLAEEHERARQDMLRQIEAYNEKYGIDFIPVPRELFRPTFFSSITVKR